jgi:hypothetical protein
MLDMPAARVRELARDALASLAPSSARRVDDDWRDQVADYVLGQQTGPESKATRGHLKHSEPARTWVSSLVDSLDSLYGDGDRPEIPESNGATQPRRRRGAAAGGAAAGAGAGTALGRGSERASSDREPDKGTDLERGEGETATESARESSTASGPGRSGAGRTSELSPEARAVVRRRRIIGAGVVAAALLAIVLAIVLIGGGDEDSDRASNPPPANGGRQGQQARLVGQAQLRPVEGGDARGVAVIAERGNQFQLLVQAQGLEPSGRDAAYEVWLYNSQRDAVSLGGQVTDNDGNLQGAGPLPPNFRTYRFVDISRERIDRNADHSGNSVLRIPMADLLRGRPPGGAAGGAAP